MHQDEASKQNASERFAKASVSCRPPTLEARVAEYGIRNEALLLRKPDKTELSSSGVNGVACG